MNKEEFKKGLESLKTIRMTDAEKSRVLENVLSTEVEPWEARVSPFSLPTFQLVSVRMVTAFSLVIVVSFSGLIYASETTLPGDTLYPIKVKVVEPFLDTWNSSLEEKIVWQAEKVERRIKEAEALAELESLDDKRSDELGKGVEQSSKAFVEAVRSKARAKSQGVVPVEKEEEPEPKVEEGVADDEVKEEVEEEGDSLEDEEEMLREEFRKRIENIKTVVEEPESQFPKRDNEAQRQKVEKLKERALRVLEERD